MKPAGVGTLTVGGVFVVVVVMTDVLVTISVRVVAEGVTTTVDRVVSVTRKMLVVLTVRYQVGAPAVPVGRG